MNIEFTVREYFEELKLMEEQYAQEEALYPWIYMLLKMIECQKEHLHSGLYAGVSIRDVHNMKYKEDSSPIRKAIKCILKEKCGAPDIAIIDKDSRYILGCVEIKSFAIKGRFQELVPGKYIVKKEVSSYTCEIKKTNGEKGETKKWKYETTPMLCVKNNDAKNIDDIQLMSHLEKCEKVLYTDGLVFYFLRRTDKEIHVEKIGDLKVSFDAYKKNDDSYDTIQKTCADWNNLLGNLLKINWHDGFKTQILQSTNDISGKQGK